VIHISKFVAEELRDPEEEEKQAKASRLQALVDELKNLTGYDVEPDELPGDEIAVAVRDSLSELFDS